MKKKIYDFLEETIKKAYAKRELSTTYSLNLYNGYSVVLTWEEGFETNDEHELCISLRKTDSSYFVCDWKIIDEDWSTSETDTDFMKHTEYIMDILSEQSL